MWQVICADVMEWCRNYTGPKFHAILCDPPYALNFMNKAWDNNIAFQPSTWVALAEHLLPGGFIMAFASSRGWHRLACALEDAGFIIQPSIFNWQTREVVEIPFCLGWLTGQSFPKSTQIAKQVDDKWAKENYGGWCECKGVEETDMRICSCCGKPKRSKGQPKIDVSSGKQKSVKQVKAGVGRGLHEGWERPYHSDDNHCEQLTYHPGLVTDLARAWEGHRYDGQILKNALEPIIVAQKPWEGKRLDCIVETGAGALWVDGGRIGVSDNDPNQRKSSIPFRKGGNEIYGDSLSGRPGENLGAQGRWPSNFCLIHVPPDENGEGGCRWVGVKRVKNEGYRANPSQQTGAIFGSTEEKTVGPRGYADPDGLETVDAWECAPDCPAWKLGEQSGELKSGGGSGYRNFQKSNVQMMATASAGYVPGRPADKGTAARFFYQADWQYEYAENCPFRKLDAQTKGQRCHKPNTGDDYATRDDLYWRIDITAPTGYIRIDKDEWEVLGKEEERTGKRLRARGNIHSTLKPIRFYHNTDWSHEIAERLAGADPVHYCPKSARRERDAELENIPLQKVNKMGSFGDQAKFDCPDGAHRVGDKGSAMLRNSHPCCKPISLCKHLATLLLPPKEYAPRRILIPFCGTMSEGIGALLAGWEEIVGIDSEQEYCDIGEARMKFWRGRMPEATQLRMMAMGKEE